MTYPGGKEGAGTLQRIINAIPPHDVYIEPFAGGAAIYRHKLPAMRSYLLDLDAAALAAIPADAEHTQKLCGDAITWLSLYFRTHSDDLEIGRKPIDSQAVRHDALRHFVFVDPPYPEETLASGCRYAHDLSPEQHARLLDVLDDLPAAVALTTYDTPQYSDRLKHWNKVTYQTSTRGGLRAETLYTNYRPADRPHDLRFWGRDKREREKLSRRRRNMVNKLRRLPPVERLQLLGTIAAEFRDELQTLA